MGHRTLETSHGKLAVTTAGAGSPALLLIHGNSSSSRVFRNELASPELSSRHQLVAFDLPGHGSSSDALDPARTYTMGGYADAAVEVLEKLGVDEVVVLGWSLGGHIGIEMIPRLGARLKGLMIVGTPPGSGEGFKESPHMGLAAQEVFSAEDVDNYAHETCGEPFEPWIKGAVQRTDGRARRIMFEAFTEGKGVNQRKTVEESDVLCAVVNGAEEPFVDLDYVDGIKYRNLWEGKCYRLPALGHAPFWEDPKAFAPYLQRFLSSIREGG